ncbi:hypothetical protein OS493_026499 [Desmophyllum pertusum]|uniref:Uncharacterized protein n=1 Tax=Desmophyllum pertusum TaxID=174260 RepID=A0A9X0CIK5_9CNID|nr:hypothetical protein OS493_026499 [Desmophyllum pertusum]
MGAVVQQQIKHRISSTRTSSTTKSRLKFCQKTSPQHLTLQKRASQWTSQHLKTIVQMIAIAAETDKDIEEDELNAEKC